VIATPNTFAVQIGRRIRAARTDRGWSVPELATAVGVTRTAVNHWEVGRRLPMLPTFVVVADRLGVDLGVLLPPRIQGGSNSVGPWRTGGHWRRTIVDTTDLDHPDGKLIGVMDSVADADLVVAAVAVFDPCAGTGWVCLSHQLHPFNACRDGCGGAPCPRCTEPGTTPALPPDTVVLAELGDQP
jgi:DNA-binding XRE family transcriptional regulator